jgi:hypothetical protein
MLHLQPDKSDDPLVLPDKNSEIVREAEETVDLATLQVPERAITVMRVRTGHFTLNVSINTLRPADRLVVTFQGARAGGKDTTNSRRPMFGRRNFDALYECPILAISDPQTEMEWDSHLPRVGMYLGTFQHDLVPEINALVNRFCEVLNIPQHRVVMYGSSSGGTSALLVGARRKQPTSIVAVVPFLRPDKYREEVVAITARAAGGTLEDWNRTMAEHPGRFNPVVALRDAIMAGRDVRCVVAQNTRDKVTIYRHYPGLWRRFDIDPEGGVSPDGRVMAVMFDSPEAGHGHEPEEYSRPLMRMAYEFFDKPVTAAPPKPKKAKVVEKEKAPKQARATFKEKPVKVKEEAKAAKANEGAKAGKVNEAAKARKANQAAKTDKVNAAGKDRKANQAAKTGKVNAGGKDRKANQATKAGKVNEAAKARKANQATKATKAGKVNEAAQARKAMNQAAKAGKAGKADDAAKSRKAMNQAAKAGKHNKISDLVKPSGADRVSGPRNMPKPNSA